MKYDLLNIEAKSIENSRYLDFHRKVNVSTGEISKGYISANYKGLEFKIYDISEKTPYNRITLEGSLHKYWNNGAHNFNNFGVNEVDEVIKDLNKKFAISPHNCKFRALEIGVNINPPKPTNQVLKSCIMYSTKPLKWVYTKDEGSYIQSRQQQNYIKLYDKQLHYIKHGFNISNEIMRIEKKYSKMHELNNLGIYTLADLLTFGLHNFKGVLLEMWNKVLFCDLDEVKDCKNKFKYSNLAFWERLNKNQRKYHKKQLDKHTNNKPSGIKKTIANLISEKVDFLNTPPQINPLYIGLKRGVFNSINKDDFRQFCVVTGINISMQKKR